MIELHPIPVESSLPEREMVWCLESSIPGRLCVLGYHSRRASYVMVFGNEAEALPDKASGTWSPNTNVSRVKPIQLSIESVIQQCRKQGPDIDGYPCVGYVMPDRLFVEVPR